MFYCSSFADHFCYLCFVFAMLSRLLIAALRSPARKGLTSRLACFYVKFSWFFFVTFPCDVLGQVWYLIASIPDLCPLTYFKTDRQENIYNV